MWKVLLPGFEKSGRSQRKTKLGRSALPMPAIEPPFPTPENAPFGTTPTTSIGCRPSPNKIDLPSADTPAHSLSQNRATNVVLARYSAPAGEAGDGGGAEGKL